MSKREMLINYVPGEECRIAITEDGRLEELYQERASAESHVGNIYKGRVLNVEPSIQAAFIDFGLERNGFLHISDLHPKYFTGDAHEETEQVGLKTPRRDRPPIQRCLRRGQSIFVQVLKEGIGTKGPTLTSYLSIPGRFLVMMPDMERVGVSRKLEDDEARRRLRDVIAKLKPPPGFGVIGRTAASEQSEADLKRDMAYLKRVWKQIDKRGKEVTVGELFAESDLVIRTIRDVYSSDIDHIIVDDLTAARRARDFLAISNPRTAANVMVYRDPIPLFHRFDLERQIETINARTVPLPSGGSLVIDSTEALVAIDVNSGKNRDNRDAEMTAYKTNLEAVDEISRQLRLRDLGGVIVNDLIDMRNLKHRRDIESRFKDNLKRDRARTRTGPISQFGTLEMTRQRMRPSLKKSIYSECTSCLGQGEVKSAESVVLDVMRRLQLIMQREPIARLELTVSPDVAFQLLNRRRQQLVMLEKTSGKPVLVRVNPGGPMDFLSLAGFDGRGGAVDVEAPISLGEPRLEPVESAVPDEPIEDELDEAAEEEQAPAPVPHRAEHGRAAAPARDDDDREEITSVQSGVDDIEPSEESMDDGAAQNVDDDAERGVEENEVDGDDGGNDHAPVKAAGHGGGSAGGGRDAGNAPGGAPEARGESDDDAAGRKRRRGRRGGRRHRARRERQREREAMEGKQGPANDPGTGADQTPMADAARSPRDADRSGLPTTSDADKSHSGPSDADHRADADDTEGVGEQSTPSAAGTPLNADGSDADETVEPSETADPEDHRPPMLDGADDEQDIPDDIGNRRDDADDVGNRGLGSRPSDTQGRQGPQDGPPGQGGDGKPRRRRRRGGRGRRGKGGGGDGGQGSPDQTRQPQGQRPPAQPHQGQPPRPQQPQPPRHPQGQRPPQPQQPNAPRPQQPRRHDQPRPSGNPGGQSGRTGNFGDAGPRTPATPSGRPVPPAPSARSVPPPPPIRHETPVPPPPPPVRPAPVVTPPPAPPSGAPSPTPSAANSAGPSRGYRGFRKLRDNTGGAPGSPGTSSNDGN